jgi:hypothetical protein
MMASLLQVGITVLMLVAWPILALLASRVLVVIFPRRRDQPGQGTFTLAALMASLAFVITSIVFFHPIWEWLPFHALLAACLSALFISTLCVSESGRRFFLMTLIESKAAVTRSDLARRYGRDQMLELRLERLVQWDVLHKDAQTQRYQLRKLSAWLYSMIFALWARMLKINW